MSCCLPPTPEPVPIPPLRAGETDGRYLDVSTDLGVIGDAIPTIDTVSIAIARADGEPMTANDLKLAGASWPNSLDASGLRVTVGFTAPPGSAGVPYWITFTVNTTFEGRLYIRDLTMIVQATMG
jgi:hypothetical protein